MPEVFSRRFATRLRGFAAQFCRSQREKIPLVPRVSIASFVGKRSHFYLRLICLLTITLRCIFCHSFFRNWTQKGWPYGWGELSYIFQYFVRHTTWLILFFRLRSFRTTFVMAELASQLLTSLVARESRNEVYNLRFLPKTRFWIVSLQQRLNEAVFLQGFLTLYLYTFNNHDVSMPSELPWRVRGWY